MKLYTFEFGSQYMDGFYQAVAPYEWRAREILSDFHSFRDMKLVSVFDVQETEEKFIYAREIDNPTYEG